MSILKTEVQSPNFLLMTQECRHPRVDCGLVEANEPARFILTRSGSFAVHVGERSYLARPGNAIFVRKNTEFRISHPDPLGCDCCTDLRLDDAAQDMLELDTKLVCREFGHGLGFQKLHLQALSGLKAEACGSGESEEVLLDLLACLLRVAPAGRARGSDARVRRKVWRVQEAIVGSPGENVGLQVLAHIACCSTFHLSRIFREQTGLSLREFRLRHRLGNALARLEAGEQDLTALAHELGFSSHSHMSQAFRQLLGAAPSAVRDEFRHRDIKQLRGRMQQLL